MTSPVSAVEAIEKAIRQAAVNLVDTLVLERETNGQSKEFSDWAVFMVMRAFKVQRADAASQAEALQRENAGSWNPIATCPVREPVDLWCVYGGEEFAQYDGGASIGKFVPNRHKSEEYGFFGNQSNNGVPRGHALDLIPVAWRKAAPQCPSELIAEVLGIPRTLDEARTLLKEETNAE